MAQEQANAMDVIKQKGCDQKLTLSFCLSPNAFSYECEAPAKRHICISIISMVNRAEHSHEGAEVGNICYGMYGEKDGTESTAPGLLRRVTHG